MRHIVTTNRAAGFALIFAVAVWLSGCTGWNKRNIRNIVPSEIVLTKTLEVNWSGSFDESEGFGLYEMSEVTSQNITEQGISFFSDIKSGKTDKWPYMEEWTLHEGSLDFSWITSSRARRLFDEKKWTDEKIYKIYSNKMHFDGGLIVVPELNLINVYFQN